MMAGEAFGWRLGPNQRAFFTARRPHVRSGRNDRLAPSPPNKIASHGGLNLRPAVIEG